jgi:hypothetical protein
MFCDAFKRLAEIPLREITDSHEKLISTMVFNKFARVSQMVDEHQRILTMEPPPVDIHAPDCVDPGQCEADWQAVWWNGMGRFLLDGQNPQSWDMAVEQFQLLQFSKMAEGCKKHVMAIVLQWTGFTHAETLVSNLGALLADVLVVGPT